MDGHRFVVRGVDRQARGAVAEFDTAHRCTRVRTWQARARLRTCAGSPRGSA
jgi:hypothetical protein